MPSYAVIGASRGIGLEFVRQLARRSGATVFAVVRNAGISTYLIEAISGLDNVHVVEADVANYQTLETAAKKIAAITDGKLDVLIHNAARMDWANINRGFDDFPSMDALDEDFIDAFKVNTLGVIHAITAFLPLLRASATPIKKIVVLATPAGDLKWTRVIGIADETAAYAATKASGAVATTKYALKLKDEGFAVVLLLPGAVDIAGTQGLEGSQDGKDTARIEMQKVLDQVAAAGLTVELQSPEKSVAAQLKTIDGLTLAQNGLLLGHTGEEWVV